VDAAGFAPSRLAPAYAGAAAAGSAASGAAVAGAGGSGFAASSRPAGSGISGSAGADPYQRPSNPYRNFAGHDGNTRSQPEPSTAPVAGTATVIELNRGQSQAPPALRLVTSDSVAETRTSGARAGRGPVELALPGVPTVSREHARFTFSDGQWWISNLGRNGLTLNGTALVGEQPVASGDLIRWGMRSDALQSRVEIG
jgi:pSer/pThr/pTyr-binding forkhead associated (FHA) protein